MTATIDPITRAHAEAAAAVRTFLPSLSGQSPQPPTPVPPSIQAPTNEWQEAIRRASMARHVEQQSARLARGLPPERQTPPSPEEQFGNNLTVVHTRALQHAISLIPEADRGKFISEAHDSATKWIASHNGKVIVHGKVHIATSPESAEKLAAQIVNDTVEEHDQRQQAEAANGGRSSGPSTGVLPSAQASDATRGAQVVRPDVSPSPSPQASSAIQPNSSGPPTGALPNSAPTIVPPGGDGKIVDPGPAPEVSPDARAQVGQTNDAGEQITQPTNSLEQNRALAMDAAPELHSALSTLTAGIPGLKYDKLRPQKDIERAKDKLDDANSPNTLSDYLGAQIAADSPQAKDKLIDALQRHFPTIEVDDHFLTGKPDKAHYPSANVQVQMGNGSTAEVQIVPREVQETNDQSHVFYKAGREAEEKGDTAERDRQWAKAAEIHGAQLEKFKARNGLGPQAQQSSMQPIGKPIQIGRHTFVRVQGPQDSVGAAPSASMTPPAAPSPEPNQQAAATPLPATSPSSETPSETAPQTPSETESSPSPNSTPAPALGKGQRVTLKDGSQADVMYVHPNLPIARVRVNGRMQEINPEKDLQDVDTE